MAAWQYGTIALWILSFKAVYDSGENKYEALKILKKKNLYLYI